MPADSSKLKAQSIGKSEPQNIEYPITNIEVRNSVVFSLSPDFWLPVSGFANIAVNLNNTSTKYGELNNGANLHAVL